MFFLIFPLARHFGLKVVVVMADAHTLLHKLLVADVALVGALLLLYLPVGDLLSETVDAVGQALDVLTVLFVIAQQFLVLADFSVGFRRVTVELNLKSSI